MMLFYRTKLTATVAFFPLFVLLSLILCTGTGLWLSALTVKYRDFRIIVPFFVQFGIFLSPIGYGTFAIPDELKLLYFLNPLVGIHRWFEMVSLGRITSLLSRFDCVFDSDCDPATCDWIYLLSFYGTFFC